MTLIPLHRPVAASPLGNARQRFQRLHLFPGRALGQDEFAQEQAYADRRLQSLLQGQPAGIVNGLEIQSDRTLDSFSLNSGLALDGHGRAITLYYPLRGEWQPLIEQWQQQHPGDDPTGVYYLLLLQRNDRVIDAPSVDPCQRLELDPTRDTRRVITATPVLQRLNITPQAVTDGTPRELIENRITADRVDADFLSGLNSAVPLALLAIGPAAADSPFSHRLYWLSVEAGRYEALPQSGYRTLLNQTSAALRHLMQQAQSSAIAPASLDSFLREQLRLDYLPAAGQLPLQWLQQIDSANPRLLWFPAHLGVDMVPVPEEAVLELIQRELPRRVIDLRQPAGDRIRLLLAVNEPDYRPDLLDIPPTDAQLEQDIYRYYLRAYDQWLKWRIQFDALYYIKIAPDDLDDQALLDELQIRRLGLPEPELPPRPPLQFFASLQPPAEVVTELAVEMRETSTSRPWPYNRRPPATPDFYLQWLGDRTQPPPPPQPEEDGLLIQYAVALVEQEALENQIRAQRQRLENTRNLLLVMRQQLDSQTVSLAALAGGVAGDGSGLQVARWLPYTNLSQITLPVESTPAPVGASTLSRVATTASVTPTSYQTAASPVKSTLALNLQTAALATTTAAAKDSPVLMQRPASLSAFELSINQSRMDKLAQIGSAPVASPAFDVKEQRFGVIDHISPEINEYAKAYYGMKEIMAALSSLFDPTDAIKLRKDLERIGRADSDNDGPGNTSPFERSSRLEAPSVLDNLARKIAGTGASNNETTDLARRSALLLTQYRYHALFKAGRILTQWISLCESRYHNLDRKLQAKLSELSRHQARVTQLAAQVQIARETLDMLDRNRVEQLGDYGVAQRLLEEDWQRVFARDQQRRRILNRGLLGLYYVRLRSASLSTPLADPLPLRAGRSSDIVPGCDGSNDPDLPEALLPFFHTVCEIPVNDWAALKAKTALLPSVNQLEFLDQLRRTRLQARIPVLTQAVGNNSLATRLQKVQQQNRDLIQQRAAQILPRAGVSSVLQTLTQTANVLSLEDLTLSNSPLRQQASDLKTRLERGACCLLDHLSRLPGSLRLQWGQLAEDDQLRVEDTSWWPGLEKAEAEDFNVTRTCAELVSWWFRQLDEQASASSRSALRNLIRALLIHASLGDPAELIQGRVQVPPRLPNLGERLQLSLNRPALPGTRLQLLDTQQNLVALLTVEDHSASGTQASITQLLQPQIRIQSGLQVVASKSTRLNL